MEILRKTAAFRVAKQTDGKAAEDVTSISLSGVPALPELWAPYTHLTHLMLVCMKPKLASLAHIGLGALPTLRLLDVSDNAVAVTAAPPALPSLARLLMPNNRVGTVSEVQHIAASFPNLEILDLVDNEVDTPANFAEVFVLFPKLVALNSKTREGAEVVVEDSDESESEGEEEESEEDESEEEEESGDGSGEESDSEGAPEVKRQRQESTAAASNDAA